MITPIENLIELYGMEFVAKAVRATSTGHDEFIDDYLDELKNDAENYGVEDLVIAHSLIVIETMDFFGLHGRHTVGRLLWAIDNEIEEQN